MKYPTDYEIAAIQHMGRATPYIINNISTGMFSIARHYGGMTYNAHHYTYFSKHDVCIRDDVVKALMQIRMTAEVPVVVTADLFNEEKI